MADSGGVANGGATYQGVRGVKRKQLGMASPRGLPTAGSPHGPSPEGTGGCSAQGPAMCNWEEEPGGSRPGSREVTEPPEHMGRKVTFSSDWRRKTPPGDFCWKSNCKK